MSNALNILKKIEEQIRNTDLNESFIEQGVIVEIKDGVATVAGLQHAQYSEIVVFQNGMKGLVLDLMPEYV
jgi:F-type H+-transporting ATPase subunit alpha